MKEKNKKNIIFTLIGSTIVIIASISVLQIGIGL